VEARRDLQQPPKLVVWPAMRRFTLKTRRAASIMQAFDSLPAIHNPKVAVV